MENVNEKIYPGTRVKAFDHLLQKGNVSIPISYAFRPGTVVKRYGKLKKNYNDFCLGPYPDLVDIKFDHRPDQISRGHFTEGVEVIK